MKTGKNLHFPIIPFKYNTKVISKSTDARIYKDVILLTPGEYTDSLSTVPIVYSEDNIKMSASNWRECYLNLDHSDEVLKRLGFIKNTYYRDKAVKGDLFIFPITTAAKDTIGLIDNGLVNWLSVEILSEDYWDNSQNKKCAGSIEYIGAAIVTTPADSHTRIIANGPAPRDIY